jgi:hypothetical protein
MQNFKNFYLFISSLFASYYWKLTIKLLILIFSTVRQENERLLQESLIRAKMAANFTDPPVISATTSSPSHPTLKVLQGNLIP